MMNAAFRIGLSIGLCVLATVAVRHAALTATLSGGFPESDDMMRLVQVRDWLAGQGWSDLRQTRLGPETSAAGSSLIMHWTRAIDVPLAGLLLILSPFLSPESAENWTRVLFPSACLALTLAGGLRLGRTLGLIESKSDSGMASHSATASLPLLFALSLTLAFTQFAPGRIDHHGPQIALLTFVYHFAFRAFDPAHSASAGMAGLLAALSIAVSVETAPLLGVACLGIVARWLWLGAPLASALRWLGIGLAGGFAAFYLIFAPAGAQAAGACDALSSAWLTAGLGGGACLIALACIAGSAGPAARLAGLGVAGAFVLASVGLLHPACLRHPYSGMDPLVVAAWLSNVNEAKSLIAGAAETGVRSFLPPVILGSLCLLFAIWSTQGLARARWLGMGAVAFVGWGLASYEIRALPQLIAICAFGAVFVAHSSVAWAQAMFGLVPAWKFVALLPMFPLIWVAVPGREPPGAAQSTSSPAPPDSAACFMRGALSAIAQEEPALTLATIDVGAFVLLQTPHRVLSAPYHRNVAGNKAAIEIFLADPVDAHARAKAAGVRFVAICPLAGDAKVLAAMAPMGLAARLLRNERIDWLAPLNETHAPLRLFEARR